jgi:hypothetical protein
MGGGERGLEGFIDKIGGTIQSCWDDGGIPNIGQGWELALCHETVEAYGNVNKISLTERDETTKNMLTARNRN